MLEDADIPQDVALKAQRLEGAHLVSLSLIAQHILLMRQKEWERSTSALDCCRGEHHQFNMRWDAAK